ncbi:carbohydrate ABC transporter permease [Paenibacillus ginsengarvi]|uniref:Carbohydrate ABC transporter permease n=1 Tax=Paenibacillus ginsengarvi TaxID=400777 RepID=A0A3B0CJQ5_9BACL|nr:carbohydrate ABC transporter permease [Paenibacillus ginsengarvi]RKN84938.1 carbohydrate ABC transporter permease [Paenibacillus ginsengarvi]
MASLASNPVKRLFTSIRNKRKNRVERADSFQKVLYVLLTLLSLFMLIPIVFVFAQSLKPYQELFLVPPRPYVENPTFNNFRELFVLSSSSVVPVTRYLFNSIVSTVLTVIGVVIVSALCAYPLSKHEFPGRNVLFATILLTLMFAAETVGIPRYLVASNLGIMNNYLGHLLPHLAAPVSVFLMKGFVDTNVPKELLEAAKIDGAREFTIFFRIVIPLIMPAVATVAILTFQAAWGDTETSRLFMQDESMKTFPFFLSTITTGAVNNVARQGAAAAATLILFLPNLLFFLFYQRKVIATMAHSGIK